MRVCVCACVRARVYGDKFINGAHWRMSPSPTDEARSGHVFGTEISDGEASAPATLLFLWGVAG